MSVHFPKIKIILRDIYMEERHSMEEWKKSIPQKINHRFTHSKKIWKKSVPRMNLWRL